MASLDTSNLGDAQPARRSRERKTCKLSQVVWSRGLWSAVRGCHGWFCWLVSAILHGPRAKVGAVGLLGPVGYLDLAWGGPHTVCTDLPNTDRRKSHRLVVGKGLGSQIS